MKLLTDAELKQRIDNLTPPLIEGLSTMDWQSKDSPIQPCSVDLHIGRIQIPSETGREPVQVLSASGDYHSLATGQTAVLTTIETLNMPPNIAGFGFPPSSVSIKGLLMTNPGHVDPGYKGPMHFTVINMARVPYPLQIGSRICTAVFLELDSAVQADYRKRRPLPAGAPGPAVPQPGLREEEVNRLAKDFVDVEKRAKEIAKDAVKRAQWTATVFAALVSVGIAAISQFVPYYLGGIEECKRNYAVISKDIEFLKEKVGVLEKQASSAPTPTPQVSNGAKPVNSSRQ
jgi:deoxycytidine triphosphate deaminase